MGACVTSVLDGSPQQTAAAGDEPESSQRSAATTRWRALIPILLLLGFAAHVAWRLWLLREVPYVVAHADEDRYLLSARALAGGPGGFGNDTEAFRRLGYPLLLVPIYWYVEDPFRVLHIAKIIGAVANALAFPLAYLFARRFLGAGQWPALGMAFVGAALPAIVYYSEFALTDVLFAPIGLAWLLLLHGWLAGRTATGRMAAAIGAGLVVGYANLVHVRGLVMLGVHLGVVVVVLWAKHGRKLWALSSAGVAIATMAVDFVVKADLGTRVEHGGVEPEGQMTTALTTALGLVRVITDTAGQFWYLAVATGGLGAVGVVVAWRAVRQPGDFAKRVMYGTILATTTLIGLASSAALPVDQRVSNHAYFRYIAFLAPAWLMIGIWALVTKQFGDRLKLMMRALAVIGVVQFVLLARMGPAEWFHPFDTPEISFLSNSFGEFRPFKATVLAVVFLALWLMRRWAIPLGVLAVVCGLCMVVVNDKSIKPMIAQEYIPGSRLVQDLGVTRNDVVETVAQVDLGSQMNHQREVTWMGVPTFDAKTGTPSPEATVVIAPWYPDTGVEEDTEKDDTEPKIKTTHWDGTAMGWTRVYTYLNGKRQWALWRRTSSLTTP